MGKYNADPKKEGKSRHIGFTSSDSTDGLLSSFFALFAKNCWSFSIPFTVKNIYLSSEKTEMLFGSTKFHMHTNQKDLIILQFHKHLCSCQSSKKSIAKTKLHQTYWNFGQFWENRCSKPLFLLKLLTQVVCPDKSQSLMTRTRQI